jgi:hypothetical protein
MDRSTKNKPRRWRAVFALLVFLPILIWSAFMSLGMSDDPVTPANYDRLRAGMMREEVAAILGEPGQIVPVYANGERNWKCSVWKSREGKRTIDVVFDGTGMMLWGNYKDERLLTRLLEKLGFKTRSDVRAAGKAAPND